MDAPTLTLTVVTPQRQLLDAPARWVDIPAASGQMRALPGHAPTLGALGAGLVRYDAVSGGEAMLVVSGGFLEVTGERVTLLADLAQLPAEINPTQARAELEALRQQPAPNAEALALAQARQQAAQGR